MMNRNASIAWSVATVAVIAVGLMGPAGCSGSEPEPVAVAPRKPPPPPPPAPPRVTPVEQLMAQLGIDERIVLPEQKAPATDDDRKAVLEFFDAFARGDAQSLGSMLSFLDQAELQALDQSGDFQRTTNGIAEILLETGNVNGNACVLALFTVDSNYQAQLWYYRGDASGYAFESAPTPPNIVNRLSGNWIESWHKILEEEIALGMMPDVELDPAALDEEPDDDRRSGGRRSGSSPTQPTPSGPGGPGGIRDPPSNPVKPPGG
ncbi:MAG: hypothetical protein ACYTGG_07125 [Planctomycetota bacterium]|jgi:hypothetical protein